MFNSEKFSKAEILLEDKVKDLLDHMISEKRSGKDPDIHVFIIWTVQKKVALLALSQEDASDEMKEGLAVVIQKTIDSGMCDQVVMGFDAFELKVPKEDYERFIKLKETLGVSLKEAHDIAGIGTLRSSITAFGKSKDAEVRKTVDYFEEDGVLSFKENEDAEPFVEGRFHFKF